MSVEETIKGMIDRLSKPIKKEEHKKNEYVSEDGYDLCVICKKKTPFKTTDNVHLRTWYVDGCGQLCKSCFTQCHGIAI